MSGVHRSGAPQVHHHDHDHDHTVKTSEDAGSASVIGEGTATAADRGRIASMTDGFAGVSPLGEVVDAKRPMGLATPSATSALPIPKASTQALGRATLDANISAAVADAKNGHVSEATTRLGAIMNNEALPSSERAEAAAALGKIAFSADQDTTRAELCFLRAKTLDPSLDVRRLELDLLVAKGRSAEANTLLSTLLKDPAAAKEPGLWQLKANLLLLSAKRPEALAALDKALALAKDQGVTGRALHNLTLDHARLLFENKRPEDAVKACEAVLAASDAGPAQLYRAHYMISELLPSPDFGTSAKETAADRKGPHAKEITELFKAANAAFKANDFVKMRELAEAILKLDKNDGLAHRVWGTAFREEQRVADGKTLIGPLSTKEKRDAQVKQLADLCAQGRAGATPKDLFPEWDSLNEVQQASVAYSVLGYGKLIPLVIQSGAKYHLVAPGESAAFASDTTKPSDSNSFGRHSYVIRGWFDSEDMFIVTGTEQINAAAYGARSTVSHEFGHLVHGLFKRAQETPAHKRTPEQKKMAAIADKIDAMFKEAKAGKNGQRLLDAYSGNSEWEYFAQATEAMTNPSGDTAKALFSANPKLWHFTREIVGANAAFPTTVSGDIDHVAVGTNAVPGPLALDGLGARTKKPSVRAAADATLAHLTTLSFPAAPREVGAPSASAVPAFWRGANITYPAAVALRSAALSGDFSSVPTQARALLDAAPSMSASEAKDAASAFCDAVNAAVKQAKWSVLEVLLSLLTLGIAAIFIQVLGKQDAEAFTAFAAQNTPEKLWRRTGEAMAEEGGQALVNEHATLGDAGLKHRFAADLKQRNPSWTDDQLDAAATQLLAGVMAYERQHPRAPSHPDAQALGAEAFRERRLLVLQRGADLHEIEAGARPLNFLSKPAQMIGVMDFTELQAQLTSELAQVTALMAKPGANLSELKALKDELLADQKTLADLKKAYSEGTALPGDWSQDIKRVRAQVLARHEQVGGLAKSA